VKRRVQYKAHKGIRHFVKDETRPNRPTQAALCLQLLTDGVRNSAFVIPISFPVAHNELARVNKSRAKDVKSNKQKKNYYCAKEEQAK
jgi:hypothetical protein